MHVDDICMAIDFCIEKGPINEIINIGTGKKIKFIDVIELAKKELNSTSKITSVEPPRFHKIIQVKDFYMDVTKLEKLGFKTKINIKEGVKKICHY